MTDDSAKPNRHELKKYQRVRNEETEKVSAPVNDLMVSASKPPGPYIRRALLLFNGPEKDEKTETDEKPELFKSITLMGRGKAVNKVVQIAEIVKRRVKGLHQITKIENTKVTDHYKPKEKESGLDDIHIDRTVGGLHITLSLDQLDSNDLGYQQPIPEDQVVEGERPRRRTRKQSSKPSGGRGRAAGRGGARRGGRGGTARGGARGAARGNSRPQSAGRGGGSKGSQRGRRGN